jgi:ankyrin repeat protein
VLQYCLPASIRQTLDQLPESLDETYVRVLSQIPQTNQAHAHRMLQCLLVAVRPLRVEELAELLAFEFDAAQGGIPKYRAAWRLDDQTQAVLSTCSSLVTIVNDYGYWPSVRQVVQFSHFSVKEFLMSDRLTSSLGDFSRYQILPGPAHTVLTQACLGFLLHLDKKSVKGCPLAEYAAQYWVEHAQFEDVASRVKDGMETLFDSDKPHFATWIGVYDIDRPKVYERHFSYSEMSPRPKPNPLYYAVFCGFYDLVKHLAIKHPQHVNAICGQYRFPLFAALSEDHVEVAELLLEHGANVDARETTGKTILLKVLSWTQCNLVDIVKLLLKHKADVNSQDNNGKTPLHILFEQRKYSRLYDEDIVLNHAQLLIEHGAEVNRRDEDHQTPLFLALEWNWFKLARILLERGADVNAENNGKILFDILSTRWIYDYDDVLNRARLLFEHGAEVNRRDKDNQTPLLLAVGRDWFTFARILLEYGADANVENNNGKSPLHLLSESWIHDEGDALDLSWLLLERGAVVTGQDKDNQTPLHLAIGRGWFELARVLVEKGADVNAENDNGETPMHPLTERRIHDEGDALNLVWLLLERGAVANRRDKINQTPLLLALERDWFKLARILLEHGADANVENKNGKSPLHLLSESKIHDEGDALDLMRLLLVRGAVVNRRDKINQTPLLLALGRDWFKLARILLEHGADANVENNSGKTTLHLLLESQIHRDDEGDALDLIRLLLERGAVANRRDKINQTPLLLALGRDWFTFARILLEHGADANAENENGKTPLHILTESRFHDEGDTLDLIWLLLGRGAVVTGRDKNNQTPLHLAIGRDWFKLARILLEHGADANAENISGRTPLHTLSERQIYDTSRSLSEHGAEANRRYKDKETPLLLEIGTGMYKLAWNWAFLELNADASAENKTGETSVHQVSRGQYGSQECGVGVLQPYPERDADINAQDENNMTPSCLKSDFGLVQMAQALLDHGANVNTGNNWGEISSYQELEGEYRIQ